MPTLSPPRFDNAQSFFVPTLTHTLKPGRYNNAQTFFAPTVTQRAFVSASVSKGRALALVPRLDVSRRCIAPMRARGRLRLRPSLLSEQQRYERRESVTDRQEVNSADIGAAQAYSGQPEAISGYTVYFDFSTGTYIFVRDYSL